MEAAFNQLQKDGKNDVDNLLKWMKDSKVINETKAQEEKVRSFFNDVNDKKNVSLEKFKEIMQKVADEFKANLGEMTKQLAEIGPTLLQEAVGGATSTLTSAFKDLLHKK